jgi:hypothetical protein
MLAAVLALSFACRAGAADDKNAQAILDRAIKALGGQEKLSQAKTITWTTTSKLKGGIDATATIIAQGLDRYRVASWRESNSAKITAVMVLAKDKGWRQVGDNGAVELRENDLVTQKRMAYLQVVPITLVPLKGKGFKVEAAGEKKVGDKPAVGLKVTPPDGKDFTLFFDKASGLPVRLVAKLVGVTGEEHTLEVNYADYKAFAGIQKATTVVWKRDGETSQSEWHITEFKVLHQVDPKTFEEPR